MTEGNAAFSINYLCAEIGPERALWTIFPLPPCAVPTAQPPRDLRPDAAHVFGQIWSFALPLVGRAEVERISVCTYIFKHMKEFSVFVNAVLFEDLKHNDKLSDGLKNANFSASCISLWQWLLRSPVIKAVKRGSQLKLNSGVTLLQTPGHCCMGTQF